MEYISMDDGARLYLRHWPDQQEFHPKGLVHIVHGMAEHSLRYEWLAKKLNAEGFEVWAADMRGHGKTADPAVNSLGKGGLLGHCFDGNGFSRVTADIDTINRMIVKERPGLPLFLLGHSWGSFLTQNYIETFGGSFPGVADPVKLAGCILSGTRGPGGIVEKVGRPVVNFLAFLFGGRRRSKFIRSLADGPYNKPFRPNRTAFDWLSRDTQMVDIFMNDPLSGQLCSSGFYRDLVNGLKQIHLKESFEKIRRDLPIFVFSGSADPVGEMGSSPTSLVNIYRSLKIDDLDFTLYPDARHETINETNREEVASNLLAWLNKHIS